jgi:hypothetical protein
MIGNASIASTIKGMSQSKKDESNIEPGPGSLAATLWDGGDARKVQYGWLARIPGSGGLSQKRKWPEATPAALANRRSLTRWR